MATLTKRDLAFEDAHAFTRLGAALDAVTGEGHLDDDTGTAVIDRRVSIARTYLFLLGYLKKDNGKGDPDSDFAKGVSDFQREAGRTDSGVLDDQTWRDLREVAAYDGRVPVARWLDGEGRTAVLNRAVRLRLFSYGLMNRAPTPPSRNRRKQQKRADELVEGLRSFARVVAVLGLADRALAPTMASATVALLFDHGRLMSRLRPKERGFEEFSGHPDLPLRKHSRDALIRRFTGNVALVELWLTGYDVRPGNFKPGGPHGRDRDGTLQSALKAFCKDLGLKVGRNQDVVLGQWFFIGLAHLRRHAETEERLSDELLDGLARDEKQLEAVAKANRSLGARILDGVKRAGRWIAALFRRVAKGLSRWIRNVTRLLRTLAQPIYGRLRAVVRVVAEGFEYFFKPVIPGSDPRHVMIFKERDFDLDVVVHHRADREWVAAFFDAVALRIRALELGGEILGQFLRIVRMVLGVISAALTWLGLVIVLVKLGNWLRRSHRLASEALSVMAQLDALESRAAGG